MKKLTQEKLDYLQMYLERQFALNLQANKGDAKNWLKSHEMGMKISESEKRELTATAGPTVLLAWSNRWLSDLGIKRFETAWRQHVFHQKQKMVAFRIKEETHRKLAAYCEINKLKLSEAIDKLLIERSQTQWPQGL